MRYNIVMQSIPTCLSTRGIWSWIRAETRIFHGFSITSSSSVLTLMICSAPARHQSRTYTIGISYSAIEPVLAFLSLHRWPCTKHGVKRSREEGKAWDKSILEKTSLSSSFMCLKLIGWKRYLLMSSFWPVLPLQGATAGIQMHPCSKAQSNVLQFW